MNILIASSFPSTGMGSIKILTFKGPTLQRGQGICSLQLQQGIGWICGRHLHPAPTALKSLGLGKGRSLLAHASNTQRCAQHPVGAANSPGICSVWHRCSCNHCRGKSFAVRRKWGGGEATLPKRQLPLSLWLRNSFLPGKGRIQGLLSLVLDASVLSSSAPLRWPTQRQCPACQSAVTQASPLLYAHGVHWESTKGSHSPTACCENHRGQKNKKQKQP